MLKNFPLFTIDVKKMCFFILILLMSSYVAYDYGHASGYNDGYFEGYIDGHITNKYITHDYANFSAEDAVNEKNKLRSMRGMNLREAARAFNNT